MIDVIKIINDIKIKIFTSSAQTVILLRELLFGECGERELRALRDECV